MFNEEENKMMNTHFFVTANYVRMDRHEADKKKIYSDSYKIPVGFIVKTTASEEDTKNFRDKYIHVTNGGYYITVDSLKELGVDTDQLATYCNSKFNPDRYWIKIFG